MESCSRLVLNPETNSTFDWLEAGERLRKLNSRCITQAIHKLKGQPALAPARC